MAGWCETYPQIQMRPRTEATVPNGTVHVLYTRTVALARPAITPQRGRCENFLRDTRPLLRGFPQPCAMPRHPLCQPCRHGMTPPNVRPAGKATQSTCRARDDSRLLRNVAVRACETEARRRGGGQLRGCVPPRTRRVHLNATSCNCHPWLASWSPGNPADFMQRISAIMPFNLC